jgi:hypothetical protein
MWVTDLKILINNDSISWNFCMYVIQVRGKISVLGGQMMVVKDGKHGNKLLL